MFCPQCGAENTDDAYHCYQCGAQLKESTDYQPPPPPPEPFPPEQSGYQPMQPPQPGYQPGANVPSHLVWSILVTLLCCWPLGIVAIVYAAQVGSKIGAGDYTGAQDSSNKAAMWCWISFGAGLLVIIPYTILIIIGAAANY